VRVLAARVASRRVSVQDAINLECSSLYSPTVDYYAHLPFGASNKKRKKKRKKNYLSLKERATRNKSIGTVFSQNAIKRTPAIHSVPRERCRFLRNASPSFLGRQPGNDPYEMVLRAGTEQYTSCAPVRPWGSKVQRRDCIGSAKEQTSTDTLYLHDFMSNQPALPRANCLFLKPI
jgi:hypothetical protein